MEKGHRPEDEDGVVLLRAVTSAAVGAGFLLRFPRTDHADGQLCVQLHQQTRLGAERGMKLVLWLVRLTFAANPACTSCIVGDIANRK